MLTRLSILSLVVGATVAADYHIPSLTGKRGTTLDGNKETVYKTALRQRAKGEATTSNRNNNNNYERKLPSNKDKGKGPSGSHDGEKYGEAGGYMKPPPEGYYPGYYPGTGAGYYPGTAGAGYYPGTSSGGYAPPPNHYPGIMEDTPLLDDAMFDDAFYAGDSCKLVTFNETFFFETAAFQIGMGGNTSQVGSQFIFSQNIYTPTGQVIDDTLLSGMCTRTSPTGVLGNSGAGDCQFNFVDTNGNYTISVQGHLDTVEALVTAGNLVVTGGSGSMVSVVGEMSVVPVDEGGAFSAADLFTGIFAYFIQASFGVIVCPSA